MRCMLVDKKCIQKLTNFMQKLILEFYRNQITLTNFILTGVAQLLKTCLTVSVFLFLIVIFIQQVI